MTLGHPGSPDFKTCFRNLGILASGSGSNFEAIAEASKNGSLNAHVAVLISDRPDAYAVKRAERLQIPSLVLERKNESRQDYEAKLQEALISFQVGTVILAGFMRILSSEFISFWKDPGLQVTRILNIHPSLLPKYPGLNAYEQAFHAGEKKTGCTVHLVDAGIDTGPILMQSDFQVDSYWDLAQLKKEGLKKEHELYPRAIEAFLLKKRENVE